MKYAELINRIAELDDIESKSAAKRVIGELLNIIQTEITNGNEVSLSSKFGKFVPSTQKARSGTNALTGKPYSSPEKQIIKFKASAALKKAVANK